MVTFATTGVSWTTFCHNNHTQRDTNTHHQYYAWKKKLYNLALMTLFDIHTGLCSSFGFILNSISYAKWKSPHCTAKYLIPAGAQYFSSTAEQKIIYMHLIFFVCVNFLNFLSPLLFSCFPSSLSLSLLPPRSASITMQEATSPLTALSM